MSTDKGPKKVTKWLNETGLRTIYDAMDDFITVITPDYEIASYNKAIGKVWGEELFGKKCYEAYQGREEICPDCAVKRCFSSGKAEYTYQPAIGVSPPVEIIAYPIKGKNGKVEAVIEHGRDISKRKKIEDALFLSEERLKEAQRIGKIGSWEFDLRDETLWWSDEVYEIYGVDPRNGPLSIDRFLACVHPEDRENLAGEIKSAKLHRTDYRIIMPDGQVKYIHEAVIMDNDENGNVIRYRGTAQDITDQQKLRDDLKKSEERYRNIIEAQTELVDRYLPGGILTFVNEALCKYVGYRNEDLLGKSFFPFIMEEDRAELFTAIESLRANDPTFTVENRAVLPDGRVRWLQWTHTGIFDDNGKVLEYQAVGRDITDQKNIELELKRSHEQFRSIMDSLQAIVYVADMDTHEVLFINRFGRTLFGDVVGKRCWESLQEGQSGPCEFCTNDRLIDGTGQPLEPYEWEFKNTKSGRWFDIKDKAITWTDGRIVRMEIATDITERKLAEEKIENEIRLRSVLLDNLECVAVILKKGSREIIALNEVARNLGAEIGGKCYEAFSNRDDPCPWCRAPEMWKSNETLDFEVQYRGSHYHGYWMPWTDDLYVHYIYDITDRKKTELALKESEEYVRNIINNVDEGFLVVDRDFRILTANRSYCVTYGTTSDDVIGSSCHKISHGNDIPCFKLGEECAVQNTFETGGPSVVLHKHIDKDGSPVYVETKAYPLKDEEGNVTRVIETINNITEKHLLEEEQLKTQKLEAIGTLAGGIAHDFNNMLQGVFSYISLAKLKMNTNEPANKLLEEAEKALDMAKRLTTQLLTFSKGGEPIKKSIGLRPIIESSVRFALSGSNTDYAINLDEDIRDIDADEGQLRQVIQNIVLNASEAMPHGGKVKVNAANVTDNIPEDLENGQYVLITVKDTGHGIPEENLKKIFDPYFTTKDMGSGLGLATSYSIVRRHGGIITVSSKPGRGTEFHIYLPSGHETTEEGTLPDQAMPGDVQTCKLLFMDDDISVRSSVGKILSAIGNDVELAERGEEAIVKYKEALDKGDPFDIVILDLTIRGGMGGIETLKSIFEIDPAVKVIISSGYSDDEVIKGIGSYEFLEKPYRIEDLKLKISSILA
ncbi:MAG: PAS domain S-box protein [Nitrospirota bacterium]|nr:MAG: PAS domain S-box protein [Nitrospirota bacterium]